MPTSNTVRLDGRYNYAVSRQRNLLLTALLSRLPFNLSRANLINHAIDIGIAHIIANELNDLHTQDAIKDTSNDEET